MGHSCFVSPLHRLWLERGTKADPTRHIFLCRLRFVRLLFLPRDQGAYSRADGEYLRPGLCIG
jgi:hypothetical protein